MHKTLEPPPLSTAALADRLAQGKELRRRVPRSAHAHWEPAADRKEPVAMMELTDRGRLPALVPLRHGRMLASPFAFYRGAAQAMAEDLAGTPTTGVTVQLCGDCHLMNFGGFATPERHFIFDVTDFDETLPGPWEWDVKRLAASVACAGRAIGASGGKTKEAVLSCVRSYRVRMREFVRMHALDVWYARIEGQTLIDLARTAQSRRRKADPATVHPRTADHLFPKITEVVDGQRRFHDHPPLFFHAAEGEWFTQEIEHLWARYRETMPDDRRVLLDRYRIVDFAMKVVGVGSVGTRCAVLLLMAAEDDPLILQFKEAGPSVLEAYTGKSRYKNHGQRVVWGQRLLQSASDLFLGWARDDHGRDFYFRQLRDKKTALRVEGMPASELIEYARLCGWSLARGHARSGDAALISGYLGGSDAFDRALAEFASTYADQTERDHAALERAVREGRLAAEAPPAD
jgi:uncharacterized protein (DUF2252 family)